MQVEVKLHDEATEKLKFLGKDLPKVYRRALNRTATLIRNLAIKEAQKEYTLKTTDAKKASSITKSKAGLVSEMSAKIYFTGKGIPLFAFSPIPSKVTKKRPPIGVSAKVKKQRVKSKGSFIAQLMSGHLGVFRSTGEKREMTRGRYRGQIRQPITEKFGPSIVNMIGNKKVLDEIYAAGAQRLRERMSHEIDFALTGKTLAVGDFGTGDITEA